MNFIILPVTDMIYSGCFYYQCRELSWDDIFTQILQAPVPIIVIIITKCLEQRSTINIRLNFSISYYFINLGYYVEISITLRFLPIFVASPKQAFTSNPKKLTYNSQNPYTKTIKRITIPRDEMEMETNHCISNTLPIQPSCKLSEKSIGGVFWSQMLALRHTSTKSIYDSSTLNNFQV